MKAIVVSVLISILFVTNVTAQEWKRGGSNFADLCIMELNLTKAETQSVGKFFAIKSITPNYWDLDIVKTKISTFLLKYEDIMGIYEPWQIMKEGNDIAYGCGVLYKYNETYINIFILYSEKTHLLVFAIDKNDYSL